MRTVFTTLLNNSTLPVPCWHCCQHSLPSGGCQSFLGTSAVWIVHQQPCGHRCFRAILHTVPSTPSIRVNVPPPHQCSILPMIPFPPTISLLEPYMSTSTNSTTSLLLVCLSSLSTAWLSQNSNISSMRRRQRAQDKQRRQPFKGKVQIATALTFRNWPRMATFSIAHSFNVLALTFQISSCLCLWELGLQQSTITHSSAA